MLDKVHTCRRVGIPGYVTPLDDWRKIETLHKNRRKHIISAWLRTGLLSAGTYMPLEGAYHLIDLSESSFTTGWRIYDVPVVYPWVKDPQGNNVSLFWRVPDPRWCGDSRFGVSAYRVGPISICIDDRMYRASLDNKYTFSLYCDKIPENESMEEYEDRLVVALTGLFLERLSL